MPLTSGATLGPYRIIEPLGRGGMASVYKAYEAALDRYVALKVLPAEFLHDPTFAERFRREAKSTAKLEHPNIIPMYASGIDENVPWMSLRLVTGGTLSSLLKRGRLDPRRAFAVLSGVAAALDYAHSQGFVHRDVKPQNVLIDEAGHVYLADFGIARMVEGSSALTQTGIVSGTPQYMAPEQARAEHIDHRVDIYALGIIAYEMLTGCVPFTADTPVAVLMKHIMDPIPLPPADDVPEALLRPLMKCLDKDPMARWPTGMSFVQALEKSFGETAPTAPAGHRPPRVASPSPGEPETMAMSSGPTTAAASQPAGAKRAGSAPAPSAGPQRTERRPSRGVWPFVAAGGFVVLLGLGTAAWFAYAWLSNRSVERAAQSPAPETPLTTVSIPLEVPSPTVAAGTPGPPAAATVIVRSGVAGATILLDGREAGSTPAELRLEQGRHLVEVARAGCTSAKQWVEARPGETLRLLLDPLCAPSAGGARVATVATPATTTSPAPAPTPRPASSSPAAGPRKVESRENAKDGLAYVFIPEGTFQMGCVPGDGQCENDEKPRHAVTLTKGFWLGRTEVTVAAYGRFVAASGITMPKSPNFNTGWSKQAQPIVNVTWSDAQAFCHWSGARLPTESEWEYAARAGRQDSKYVWGDEKLPIVDGRPQANVADAALKLKYSTAAIFEGYDDGFPEAAPVASFAPSGHGLFDMAGNVWEWVADWYAPNYAGVASADPAGPTSGSGRVQRGGSWYASQKVLRVSSRSRSAPGTWNGMVGFRCARDASVP